MAERYEPNPNPAITSDLNVDITNYTSTQNQYTCPEEGYIFIYITDSTGYINIGMLPDNFVSQRLYASASGPIYTSVFVRRGTTVRVDTNSANGKVFFRGIKNVN